RTVVLWDGNGTPDWQTTRELLEPIQAIAMRRDVPRVFTGGGEPLMDDNSAELLCWDMASGKLHATLQTAPDDAHQLAIAPDGRTLAVSIGTRSATARPGKIELWDMVRGEKVGELYGPKTPIWALGFSSRDNLLASASGDLLRGRGAELVVWNVAAGR